MTLSLELGGIQSPEVRRAFEQIAQQFPVAAAGGGGGGAPTGPAGGDLGATYPNPTVVKGQAGFTVGGTAVVLNGDARLTDARSPTAHHATHEPGGTDAMAVDAAAATGSLRTIGTGALQATAGNDSRLTNARTPTAHAASHQPGGSDAMAVDAAAATGSLRTLGTGAAQAAAGNDARLSDARTPTAHTHPASDVVSGVLATARLGSGTPAASTYVDGGTGAWTELPAAGSGVSSTTLDTWHVVGGAGEPAYTNSWVSFGAPYPGAQFRKDANGKVYLRGLIKSGTIGAVPVFTLPAGYRPNGGATNAIFAVAANNAYGQVEITAAGQVDVTTGTNAFVSLEGIQFDTDSVTTIFGWTALARQAADVTSAVTTLANTDLVFTFAANSTYLIDLYLLATSAATTTGYALAFDTSAAVTAVGLTFEHQLAAAGTLTGGDSVADGVARSLSSGVPTAAALTPILGKGILVSGASTGTCRLQFAPEVAASATFKAGSTMRVMKAA